MHLRFGTGKYKKRKFTKSWIPLLALLFGTSESQMEDAVKRPRKGASKASLAATLACRKAGSSTKKLKPDQEVQLEKSWDQKDPVSGHQAQREGFHGFPVASLRLRSGATVRAPAHMFSQGGLLAGLADVCLCCLLVL